MSENTIVNVPATEGFEIQFYIRGLHGDISRNTDYPVHVHDFLEIYYLIEGDISFMVDNTIYRMKAGDAVFTRPNQIHHCIVNSSSPHRHACFWFMTDSPFLLGPFLRDRHNIGNLLSSSDPDTVKKIGETVILLDSLPETDTLARFSALISLLNLWRGCLGIEGEEYELPGQLKLIVDDISENLPEIKNLSYLTEKYYMSQSQLRRMFARHLGTTPKAYIESKRLAYSRILLRSGASVTEACMQSGFSDLSNYIRLFRTVFGLTPSDYRRGINIADPNRLKT